MSTIHGTVATPGPDAQTREVGTADTSTRALIACGAFTGPSFWAMVIIQTIVRPGFDFQRHPISLLSLGDLGWMQQGTFVLTGLAGIAFATGVRRLLRHGRGGVWGAALLGIWGLSLIAAGVFTPDPSLGFPPGTAQGIPGHISWHSTLHGVAFSASFVALAAACFVFARRFAGLRRWAWMSYCIATGVVAPVVVGVAQSGTTSLGTAYAIAGAVAFAWVTLVGVRLLAQSVTGRA